MREYHDKMERVFLKHNKTDKSCCNACFYNQDDCDLVNIRVNDNGKKFILSASTICFSRPLMYFHNQEK